MTRAQNIGTCVRVLGFKMARQACQNPESGVFSDNASFTEIFIDEGDMAYCVVLNEASYCLVISTVQ